PGVADDTLFELKLPPMREAGGLGSRGSWNIDMPIMYSFTVVGTSSTYDPDGTLTNVNVPSLAICAVAASPPLPRSSSPAASSLTGTWLMLSSGPSMPPDTRCAVTGSRRT